MAEIRMITGFLYAPYDGSHHVTEPNLKDLALVFCSL